MAQQRLLDIALVAIGILLIASAFLTFTLRTAIFAAVMYLLLFPVVYEVFHRLLAGFENRRSAT